MNLNERILKGVITFILGMLSVLSFAQVHQITGTANVLVGDSGSRPFADVNGEFIESLLSQNSIHLN